MAEHPSPSWRQHWDAWALGSPGLSWLFASPQKGRKGSLGGHEWLARRASDIFLCRVTVGNWLGPSALCHTLESVVNHVQPAGLQCRVVASSGGGAPVMCTTRCGSCLFLCSLWFIHRGLELLLHCCGRGDRDRLSLRVAYLTLAGRGAQAASVLHELCHEQEGLYMESIPVACRVAAAFADSHSAAGTSGAAEPTAAAAAPPAMPGAGTEQQGGAKGLLLLVPLMLGLHGKVKLARTGWSKACTYWQEQSMHMPSCHNMATVC